MSRESTGYRVPVKYVVTKQTGVEVGVMLDLIRRDTATGRSPDLYVHDPSVHLPSLLFYEVIRVCLGCIETLVSWKYQRLLGIKRVDRVSRSEVVTDPAPPLFLYQGTRTGSEHPSDYPPLFVDP